MEIKCEKFRQWYPALKSGKLSPAEEGMACDHLNSCQACQRAAQVIEGLLQTTIQPELDPFFYTRLSARLGKEKAPRVAEVLRPALALTFALTLALFIGIRLGTLLYQKFTAPELDTLTEQEYAINTSVSQLDQVFYDYNSENQ